jgi:hypothetical protein
VKISVPINYRKQSATLVRKAASFNASKKVNNKDKEKIMQNSLFKPGQFIARNDFLYVLFSLHVISIHALNSPVTKIK